MKRVEDAVGAVHVGLAELQLAATDTTKNSNEKFQDEATAKYDKESRPTGPSVEADGFTVECSTGVGWMNRVVLALPVRRLWWQTKGNPLKVQLISVSVCCGWCSILFLTLHLT